MGLKLYAGTGHEDFEYAVWASNKINAAVMLPSGLDVSDQSKNRALQLLIQDRTRVYRRDLRDENATWVTK